MIKGFKMRILLSLFIFSLITVASAQKDIKFISYDFTGNSNDPDIDTLIINDSCKTLDVHFLAKHINLPDFMPSSFVDQTYKNETLTIWFDSKRRVLKKELRANIDKSDADSLGRISNTNDVYSSIPSYSYSYDSLSRVNAFSYNGCENCNRIREEYKVVYDRSGRIIRMTEQYFYKVTIEFIYSRFNDIVKVRMYEDVNVPSVVIEIKK